MNYDEIRWFIPRPSYDPDTRALPREALDTLTECESLVETMSLTEIAAWICDLLTANRALVTAFGGAMDDLHDCLEGEEVLRERVRGLLRINQDLRAEVQRLAGVQQ